MIKRQQKGFTIVELLIVIVVIGILAAISIVAFNGIQTRAENTKTITAVGAYVKALKVYASDKGYYPKNNPVAYVCLSSNLAGDNCSSAGALCSGLGGVGGANAALNEIKTVLSSLPDPSKQRANCTSAAGTAGTLNGILYYSADTVGTAPNITNKTVATIYYILKNSDSCSPPSGFPLTVDTVNGEARVCGGNLPAPE